MATAQWSDKNIENMGYSGSGVRVRYQSVAGDNRNPNILPSAAGAYILTAALIDGKLCYDFVSTALPASLGAYPFVITGSVAAPIYTIETATANQLPTTAGQYIMTVAITSGIPYYTYATYTP